MTRRAFLLALFLLVASQALADTLVLKSGESKKGKIVEELETLVLLKQPDGLVVEVPRSQISILDKDPAAVGSPQGGLNVFSEPPNKKPYKLLAIADPSSPAVTSVPKGAPAPAKISDKGAMSFDAVADYIEHWLAQHPEFEQKLKDLFHKNEGKTEDLKKLVDTIQSN